MIPFIVGFWQKLITTLTCWYNFDGVNEYIDINSAIPDLVSQTTGTVSFWINANILNINNPFFGLYLNTSNAWWFRLRSDNKLQYFCRRGGTVKANYRTNNTFTDNTWYNVCFVQDGTKTKIYVNGVNQSLNKISGNDDTVWFDILSGVANNANIGSQIGTSFFNGSIDEVSIWNTDLSPTEILDIYNLGRTNPDLTTITSYPTNITSHWRLAQTDTFDGTNWTVVDELGNNTAVSVNMDELNKECE